MLSRRRTTRKYLDQQSRTQCQDDIISDYLCVVKDYNHIQQSLEHVDIPVERLLKIFENKISDLMVLFDQLNGINEDLEFENTNMKLDSDELCIVNSELKQKIAEETISLHKYRKYSKIVF